MKRYLVFALRSFYPLGGMDDLLMQTIDTPWILEVAEDHERQSHS